MIWTLNSVLSAFEVNRSTIPAVCTCLGAFNCLRENAFVQDFFTVHYSTFFCSTLKRSSKLELFNYAEPNANEPKK